MSKIESNRNIPLKYGPKLELRQAKIDQFVEKSAGENVENVPFKLPVIKTKKLCDANIEECHLNIANIGVNIGHEDPNIDVNQTPKLTISPSNPPALSSKPTRFSDIKSIKSVVRLPNPVSEKTQSGLDEKKIELMKKKGRKYKCFGRKEDSRILVKCNQITKYFKKDEPTICIQGKRKIETTNFEKLKKMKVVTSD